MTDKATMPEVIWAKIYRSDDDTIHIDAVPFLMDDRTSYTLTEKYDSLAQANRKGGAE